MKKKIAVVTWLGQGNFGTTLQAYALREFIQKLGYEVVFPLTFNIGIPYRIKKFIIRMWTYVKPTLPTKKKTGVKYDKLNRHLQTYTTVQVKNRKEYKTLQETTHAFVTGSDQIWNTWHSYDPFYFLNFAKRKKRIAYASSIGTDNVPEKYQKKVKKHLMKFQHIGVREASAVKVLSALTGRNNIIQVADPTLLLTEEEWDKLTTHAEVEILLPDKYMLCYLIGNNAHYFHQLEAVREKWGNIPLIVIPAEENTSIVLPTDAQIYKDAGPAEFVYLIQHAAVVCTDSFHATALSINMGIDFVEFVRFGNDNNQSQNSRINDLLTHYRLADRFFQGDSELWATPINYLPVKAILEKDRGDAFNYLTKAIEN